MRRATVSSRFNNRVRFNWGYHAGRQAVREGWDNVDRNFGFGDFLAIATPVDVVLTHPDRVYAQGWIAGLEMERAGVGEETSETAWNASGIEEDAFGTALVNG